MTRAPEPTLTMTPKMVAERWRCSERHIRNLLEQGYLPYFRLGGKLIRILREDVVEFERRGGSEPTPEPEPAPRSPLETAAIKRLRAERLTGYSTIRRSR